MKIYLILFLLIIINSIGCNRNENEEQLVKVDSIKEMERIDSISKLDSIRKSELNSKVKDDPILDSLSRVELFKKLRDDDYSIYLEPRITFDSVNGYQNFHDKETLLLLAVKYDISLYNLILIVNNYLWNKSLIDELVLGIDHSGLNDSLRYVFYLNDLEKEYQESINRISRKYNISKKNLANLILDLVNSDLLIENILRLKIGT